MADGARAATLERVNGLRRDGKLEEAYAVCEELLGREPQNADALFLAGVLDLAAERHARAVARLKLAVELRPDRAPYLVNLGIAYAGEGSLAEAEAALRGALLVRPSFPPALRELGVVLCDRGSLDEALALLTTAVSADPTSLAGQYSLAQALLRADRTQSALARFEQALAIAPRPTELRLDFARQLVQAAQRAFRAGRLDEVVALRERALVLDPDQPENESALVFLSSFRPGLGSRELLEAAVRWNDRYARKVHARRRPHPHDRSPERRLRVGYVSPDFRAHVQRFFVPPVLRAHEREHFEIVCYSSVKYPDEWTAHHRALADEWHDVSRLDDTALAEKIRGDGIDVLVDLTLHMPGCRLLTFAERPSPVQISWLAYPGTTGVDGIDYRITDHVLDPDGAAQPYSERSLRLSHPFWCFAPFSEEPAVTPLPALSLDHVTFGCLNNFLKLNQGTLALFARVLGELPGSRLVLHAPDGQAREGARSVLERHGVSGERVTFVGRQGHDDYLRIYQGIDVALDCLPYNGHTTNLDAHWMGVPVITQVGPTVVGRAGLCIARALGLDELVTHDADGFVTTAVGLARSPERLAGLRATLRERLRRSPLMDVSGFTRDLEQAYRSAWRAFCAG